MRKKILALLFCFIFSLTNIMPVFAELPIYNGIPEVKNVLPKIKFTDTEYHWAKVAISKMAAQGIISGEGNKKFNPEGALQKKHAFILILKALGYADDAESIAENLAYENENGKTDNDTYFAKGYLLTAVEEEIITPQQYQDLEQKLDKPAERQEVAYWLAKAIGLPLAYGTEQKLVRNFDDWKEMNPNYVSAIESLIKEHYMSGKSDSEFDPKGKITRAEMATLLNNVYKEILAKKNLQLEKGNIVSIHQNWYKFTYQREIEITTDGGKRFNLVTHNNSEKPSEVFVLRNGVLGDSSILQKNDRISFYFDTNGTISFIEAYPNSSLPLDGYIKTINDTNGTITIENPSGQNITFPWVKSSKFIIDNRPANINDFVIGQDVTIDLRGEVIGTITGTFGGQYTGYDEPRKAVISGRIKDFDDQELYVLTDKGDLARYHLTDNTWISKDDKFKTQDVLRVGDRIKLTFNDLATKEVDKLEISQELGKLVRVVKGELQNVYAGGNKVALSKVKELVNGQWNKVDDFDFLELLPDAEIYVYGRAVNIQDLNNNLTGKDVYLAYTDSFGKEEGIKLVVENGTAKNYSQQIDKISYGSNSFDLEKYAFGINVGPETIITRNNKLVDFEDIDEGDKVFTEINTKGDYLNSIVLSAADYVPTTSEFAIYRGRFDYVEDDYFKLRYASEYDLDDFSWDEEDPDSGDRITIDFDDDTVFTDTTLNGEQDVDPEKFAESRWSNHYEDDYYAFVIEEDDLAKAVHIWKNSDIDDDFDIMKTSVAKVESIDHVKEEVNLKYVNDWSVKRREWNKNDYSLKLDLKNSLIIKDNEQIEEGNIEVGDEIYVIHNTQKAAIVIVQ